MIGLAHPLSQATATTTKPTGDPTAALMNDIAKLSIDYAEARWQRALLSLEIRARAIVRIVWFSLLALPPGLLAAFFAGHALAHLLIEWGVSAPAAYGILAVALAALCVGAIFVAKRTAERWLST